MNGGFGDRLDLRYVPEAQARQAQFIGQLPPGFQPVLPVSSVGPARTTVAPRILTASAGEGGRLEITVYVPAASVTVCAEANAKPAADMTLLCLALALLSTGDEQVRRDTRVETGIRGRADMEGGTSS